MTDVLVKFPTRSRPEIFRQTMEMWQRDPLPRFLVTADLNDPTMNNPGMRDWLAGQERVKVRFGNSRTKIEAINDGVADEPFQLLILAADDMIPTCADYAQRIVKLFDQHFPSGDGVLHTNDGRAGRKLNTLPILDRAYFDRTGYIYNPEYTSVFADNEFQEVSESLLRAAYVDDVLIRHAWTEVTGRDPLHLHNESFYQADEAVYRRRKAAGFPVSDSALERHSAQIR